MSGRFLKKLCLNHILIEFNKIQTINILSFFTPTFKRFSGTYLFIAGGPHIRNLSISFKFGRFSYKNFKSKRWFDTHLTP